MAILIKSEHKNKLEEIFGDILEHRNFDRLSEISNILTKCFGKNINVNIITNNSKDSFFVMSVIPDESVIEKITASIMVNDKKDIVSELWKDCDNWTLEMDSRIFDVFTVDLSAQELTALVLHEIGHVINTNAVSSKINNVIKYKIATSPVTAKVVMSNNSFSKLLHIPIINGCIFNKTKASLKNELRADNFAVRMGYLSPLTSAIEKISKINNYEKNTLDSEISSGYDFSSNTISNLNMRRNHLNKAMFLNLMNRIPNGTKLKYNLNALESALFEGNEMNMITSETKMRLVSESVDKIIDSYYTEFLNFGRKSLRQITRTELDYIDVQIMDMKTNDDRLMILSYINSKLDLCDYYITIINDKNLSKKYDVPQSLTSLLAIRKRLLISKKKAFAQKIPTRIDDVHVFYPTGYEG